MSELFCPKLGVCGGCAWGMRPLAEQRQAKLATVSGLGVEVSFVDGLANLGLRDRADLVWENGALGLYRTDGSRTVVDLPTCPMMSESLSAFYKDFRKQAPPGVRRGSVRLRVSPNGERGVWLDFANEDVKALFTERNYLQWLSALAFVEIGQRRKALVWRDGAPKLVDPVLKPWFETYDENCKGLPLWGPVGGFSQAGFQANRKLVECVGEAVSRSQVKEWTELFSGNGNFALALAARGYDVEAFEIEDLAVQGLELSLREHSDWKLKVSRLDVYLKAALLPPLSGRALLVDPPRAGLREVLKRLEESGERPRALVYVSCFSEVFAEEAERLKALGYHLRWLKGVDQFAHSPHAEWVALFTVS